MQMSQSLPSQGSYIHLLLRKFIGRHFFFEIETCIVDHMTYDNIVVIVNKTSLVGVVEGICCYPFIAKKIHW